MYLVIVASPSFLLIPNDGLQQPDLLPFEDFDPHPMRLKGPRFQFATRHNFPQVECVLPSSLRVAQPKRRAGTRRYFRVEIPGSLDRLSGFTQPRVRRRKPPFHFEIVEDVSAGDGTKIHNYIPSTFLVGRWLWQGKPVEAQPFLAQWILASVKKGEPADYQWIATFGFEAQGFEQPAGGGVCQRTYPKQGERPVIGPACIGVVRKNGLKISPFRAIAQQIRQSLRNIDIIRTKCRGIKLCVVIGMCLVAGVSPVLRASTQILKPRGKGRIPTGGWRTLRKD